MANVSYIPYAQQAADIERQRKYAELLQQQAAEPLQSQMVGGRVVPLSPWLGLAKMLQAGLGSYAERKAGEQEAEMKKQAREEYKQNVQDFISAIGPQKAYTSTPVMEQSSDEDRTEMAPKMQWSDETGQMEPVQDWKETLKPGLNRNQAIARLLEMQGSENPYISAAAPTLTGLLPKAAEEEEYGTPFESGGQMYTMSKSGNVKPLNLAAPTKQASLPSSVQEYEYAVKQGFKGSLADYEKMKAINVNVPAAETYGAMTTAIDPVTGQPIYVRGGSRGSIQRVEGFTPPPKAPTQEQVVAGTYANKIQDAENVLGKFGAGSPYKPPSVKEQFKADIPLIGNQLIDEPTQTYKVAERAFIEAWLRKTSGAVISPSEFEQARKQYIPQPNDSDAVLEQKRQARQRVLQGMKQGAGQYYEDAEIPPGFNVVGGNQ